MDVVLLREKSKPLLYILQAKELYCDKFFYFTVFFQLIKMPDNCW